MKGRDHLKDWYILHLKHRDIFDKKIQNIEDKSDSVIVQYKNQSLTGYIKPFLENPQSIVEEIKSTKEQVHLVTYNNKQNLHAVLEVWDDLAECKNLKVIFANPDAEGDHKWIIVPYTHSKITPPSSLKSGLESLFQTVEQVQG